MSLNSGSTKPRRKQIDRELLHAGADLILNAIEGGKRREGTERTAERIARDWPELFEGYNYDVEDILNRTFDAEGYDEMIIREEIRVDSFCEHHILPFTGLAWVGYIPGENILGLDKIDKLVQMYSHRLQNQERLTQQIANTLWTAINPKGVMVVLRCEHDCMKLRGIRSERGLTTTSAVRGVFKEDLDVREEFLRLISRGKG